MVGLSVLKMSKKYSIQEAYSRATALCSKSEKCVVDIRKKLFDWSVESDDYDDIINSLIENKYIDEERFATYYVRDKYRFNGWGRVKIQHHLIQKQIPLSYIENALQQIDEKEYLEKLKRALQIKKKALKNTEPYEQQQKLMRFAAGRGYTPEEINKVLVELEEGDCL